MSSTNGLNALLGFCESAQCRRQALLRYFGDPHDGGCDNCDNCLDPPETFDATTVAQKALSCVYRSGQRFGIAHLVDILVGNRTEKVERFAHDELSTFGIGGELKAVEWKGLFRQLIAAGLCDVDPQRYNAVVLNARSRDLLRGETTFQARKHRPREKAKKAKSPRSPRVRSTSFAAPPEDVDEGLFDALRVWRKDEAAEAHVPPYIVFSDRTLREIAAVKPASRDDLLAVPGVGATKLDRYGDAVLDVVRRHG